MRIKVERTRSFRDRDVATKTVEPVSPGRALVLRQASPSAAPPQVPLGMPAGRALAPFLAHLIATDLHVPQARVRRRAETGEALAAYAAASRLVQ